MLKSTYNWFIENSKYLPEIGGFAAVVFAGFLVKVKEAIGNGTIVTLKWFVLELITSFFVALTTYAIFDQCLNCKIFFTLMMCAFAGSMSATIRERSKDFVVFGFETIKIIITNKVKKE